MIKKIILVLIIQLPFFVFAQRDIDSLKKALANADSDSARYRACKFIYDHYEESIRDSAFYYANRALLLARENNKKLAEIHSLDNMAYQLLGLGRYAESLQYLLEALKIVDDPSLENEKSWILFTASFSGDNRRMMLAYTHHIYGILMWQTDNNPQAIVHFSTARRISAEIGHSQREMMANMNLGRSYLNDGKPDSALLFEKEAEKLTIKTNFKKYLGQVYSIMAGVYRQKNDRQKELLYLRMAVQTAIEQNNLNNLSANYFLLTRYYIGEAIKDSAIFYAKKNLETILQLGPVAGLTVNIGTVYENLYLAYKLSNQQDSIFKYQGLTLAVKDSLYRIRIKNLTEFQNLTLKEQVRLQNAEKEKELYQNRIRIYVLLGGLLLLVLIGILLYRNNRQKQKANEVLQKALTDLKITQQQLVQSEKMASLGELTAGIAHEIQNPLNFVNNFSEVSYELIDEMNEELNKGDIGEAKAIANDVKQNLEKINHHGKRADAIVKGMLQHSRSSSGQKEPTDINALADEYLRLAYHGLRAKDKSFNATMKTDFDESIGNINIIPQDIGRVILNLITNAFYVVDEKKKTPQPPEGGVGYEPTVSVTTKRSGDKISISVKDNGAGIPSAILDKIFQPFFTTKPTGQGTGLGLSLSYDIVKAHGGELKVETGEGQGTTFIIQLPA